MRGSEALRWDCKPVYNLERTLSNEGDDLWSETKAKATDVGTTSLLAACLMCTLWDLKVFYGGKRVLSSDTFTEHCMQYPGLLLKVCGAHQPIKTLRSLTAKRCCAII